jgi:hypothetical protein
MAKKDKEHAPFLSERWRKYSVKRTKSEVQTKPDYSEIIPALCLAAELVLHPLKSDPWEQKKNHGFSLSNFLSHILGLDGGMETKNKRRWVWMLATGAAVAGGAYLLYNAWSLVCARVCVCVCGFVCGGGGGGVPNVYARQQKNIELYIVGYDGCLCINASNSRVYCSQDA